jgi:hypothetical protein
MLRGGLAMEPPSAAAINAPWGLRVQGNLYLDDTPEDGGGFRCGAAPTHTCTPAALQLRASGSPSSLLLRPPRGELGLAEASKREHASRRVRPFACLLIEPSRCALPQCLASTNASTAGSRSSKTVRGWTSKGWTISWRASNSATPSFR